MSGHTAPVLMGLAELVSHRGGLGEIQLHFRVRKDCRKTVIIGQGTQERAARIRVLLISTKEDKIVLHFFYEQEKKLKSKNQSRNLPLPVMFLLTSASVSNLLEM